MSILAIDPGNEMSAFVIWDGEKILTHGKVENRQMVVTCNWSKVKFVEIEMIASYGMAVGKEVFDTAFWVGRFFQSAESNEYMPTVGLMYRREVKLNLCGTMKAKDSNIRQALIDRFGKPGTKAAPGLTYGLKADTWQAFAIAVTAWDNMNGGGK